MGKQRSSRRFRGHKVRSNPINGEGMLVENGGHNADESGEDLFKRIISQLQSGSSEDRECGLSSLAQLDDNLALQSVRDHRVVRVAGPLLVDTNLSVKHAAVGALKNLSLASGEICDEMVEQDIMTPLCTLLMTYAEDWSASTAHCRSNGAESSAADEKIDSKTEIFIQCVDLLSNLCEASTFVVQFVNEKQMIPFIMNHLNLQKFGPAVVSSVLQFLYSLTEDNKEAANHIRDKESLLRPFIEAHSVEPSSLLHSNLVYGILLNVAKSDECSNPLEKLFQGMMLTISQTLDQDQRKMIHDFSSEVPMEEDNDDLRDKSSTSDKARQLLDDVLRAQLTALEIFTNLCCDDSSDVWEDADSSGEEDDSMMNGDDNDSTVSSNNTALTLPTFVQEAIIAHNLTAKVLSKSSMPAHNVVEILSSDRRSVNVIKLASCLRMRSYLCLSNLVQALSVDDLGGFANLCQMWTQIGQQCFGPENEKSDTEFFESATSALRAITQKFLDHKLVDFLQAVTPSDLEQILNVGALSQDASVRMNIVNMAGNIVLLHAAKVPALSSSETQLPNIIIQFLVEAATRDVDLRVVSEALDKIIDIFSEDDTDLFCVELNLIHRLRQLLPGLKVKLGQHKRQVKKSDETLGLISMAKLNLVRFIKYKEKRPTVAKHLNKKN